MGQETTREPLFRVQGLTRAYGGKTVLDGVDFELRRGECLVVLGRSGSGKSVTLRHLNGLESPDRGSVVFDGLEITGLGERELYPLRRRVGMLFQSAALFDSMSVFDNVAFPLREHTDLDEQAVAAAVRDKLQMVRLHDVEDRLPADLSGGMKKRVGLARAMALEPEALLYDEPTAGLDPVTSAVIGQLIHQTGQRFNMAAVVVTHDLPLARLVGDRLALLDRGRFRFLGTWDEAAASGDRVLQGFLAGDAEVDDEL